jgi:hypothetical protein
LMETRSMPAHDPIPIRAAMPPLRARFPIRTRFVRQKRRRLLKRVENADARIGRVSEKSVSAAKNIARSIVQTCFSNRFRGFSLCCNARCDSKANVAD